MTWSNSWPLQNARRHGVSGTAEELINCLEWRSLSRCHGVTSLPTVGPPPYHLRLFPLGLNRVYIASLFFYLLTSQIAMSFPVGQGQPFGPSSNKEGTFYRYIYHQHRCIYRIIYDSFSDDYLSTLYREDYEFIMSILRGNLDHNFHNPQHIHLEPPTFPFIELNRNQIETRPAYLPAIKR